MAISEAMKIRGSRPIGRFAAWVSGYDLFISYRHADAGPYAKALESILESKGLMVFRDESEEDAGSSLLAFVRYACSARTFVILITQDVYTSPYVSAELSAYLKYRMDRWYRRPFSRVISINVEQALNRAPAQPTVWARLADYVYLSETSSAVELALPSNVVVERLSRSSSFVRSWRRFFIAASAVAVTVVCAIVASSSYLYETLGNLSAAQEKLGGVSQQLHSRTEDLNSVRLQLADAKNATTRLQDEQARLLGQNNSLDGKNKQLGMRAQSLTREVTKLETIRRMLAWRNAALSNLTIDPLVAYRLAEKAYRFSPDKINRQLIMKSISSVDLSYQVRALGYSIESFVEPWILLKRVDEEDRLWIFDTRTRALERIDVSADRGWLVPMVGSWRILTLNWLGEGMDAVPSYCLWDSFGSKMGACVQSVMLRGPQFVSKTKVIIALRQPVGKLVWDLATNKRDVVGSNAPSDSQSYFYDIYGPLDTRSDGVSAAHYDSGLVLVDKDGQVRKDSYTPVSFDPSSFFTSARWSVDGQFLALNYFDQKRLGIWNPLDASFYWLDPDNWAAERYDWSQAGHLLAFSGRTVNELNVTVEIVDASAPQLSRKLLYTSAVPVNSLAFLPGDKKLAVSDKEGSVFIIDLTGHVFAHGVSPEIERLYGGRDAVYSSSSNDFRSWDGRSAPAKHWSFRSTPDRMYSAVASADANWRWLVVPYRGIEGKAGIELRAVDSDQLLDLEAPTDQVINMAFTPDGKWLIIESFDALWVYGTDKWRAYKFSLVEGDHQFLELRVNNEEIRAQAIAGGFLGDGKRYTYMLSLRDDSPVLVGRALSDARDDEYEASTIDLSDKVKGWDLGTLYKYRSASLRTISEAGWAYFAKCRDQALGARDCDVQFVPVDVEKLMSVYNPILWKPSDQELEELIRGD